MDKSEGELGFNCAFLALVYYMAWQASIQHKSNCI
jgi:hypothetical protein